MFEKLTMFDFKFLLVCSLVCSLPVIPCKDDKPNLIVSLKLLVFHVAIQSSCCQIEQKSKYFPIKIFQKTSQKHWQKNLRKILEFLTIERLRFRVFTIRKTQI